MAEPIAFSATTARFALPLLFQGQAQKEFYFNEAISLIDAIMLAAVEGEATSPPASPVDGECWLVAPSATGDWAGEDEALAILSAGAWNFVQPANGMTVFDKAAGQFARYDNAWQRALTPASPAGGAVIDAEARSAISEICDALRIMGAIPSI